MKFLYLLLFFCLFFSFSISQQDDTWVLVGGDFMAYTGENSFLNGIGIWRGSAWVEINDSPKSIASVADIISNGTFLYIVGRFKQAKGLSLNSIAQLDTVTGSWKSLGNGINGEVNSVAVYGDSVYVAGKFLSARNNDGEIVVYNIAAFDVIRNEWRNLQQGLPDSVVVSIVVGTDFSRTLNVYAVGILTTDQSPFISQFNVADGWVRLDNTQANELSNRYYVVEYNQNTFQLYVGGKFSTIGGGTFLNGIAYYHEATRSWLPLGTGTSSSSQINDIVFSPDCNEVIIGGSFEYAGTQDDIKNNIALWNGTDWYSLGSGIQGVVMNQCDAIPAYIENLLLFNGTLYVSGRFSTAGGQTVHNIAQFNLQNRTWSSVGNDTKLRHSLIYAMAKTDNGKLYVLGQEQIIFRYSEFVFNSILFQVFENNDWVDVYSNPLDSFLDVGHVQAILNNGSDIYVAGSFLTAANIIINNIAKWNLEATTWSPLGNGIQYGHVRAMAIWKDTLFIAGFFNFTTSDGKQAISIAQYNAVTNKWRTLGSGIVEDCKFNNTVYALAIDSDNNYLYAGGSFLSMSPDFTSPNLARWNLQTETWELVGTSGVGDSQGVVRSLIYQNNILWIGGYFELFISADQTVFNLAQWNTGTNEWVITKGVQLLYKGNNVGVIYSMVITSSNNLIIGGMFDQVDGIQALNVAMFSLYKWKAIGLGLTNADSPAVVRSLAYDIKQNILYAGGTFSYAGDLQVQNIARWDDSKSSWTGLSIDISSWSGGVSTILVMGYTLQPIEAYSFFKSLTFLIGAPLLAISLLIFSIFVIVHYIKKRRKSNYILLPQYPVPEVPKISLRDLANDIKIKQIPETQLQITKRIAFGASGEVCIANYDGEIVAIKRVSLSTQKVMEDFLYEIKLMSSLKHENVLKFIGTSISQSGEVLLVMQYMEHGSVRDLLDRTNGKVDWKLKLRLAIDAARGMEYLHSCNPPIIHRDLKSSNLLIDKKWRCYISDFGISRLKNTTQYNTLNLTGTPAYMAPEVIRDNRISEKADVYSFGVILVEFYTGQAPYSDLNFPFQQVMYSVVNDGLRPTLPENAPISYSILVEECLTDEPSRRPDFGEIKTRLRRYL